MTINAALTDKKVIYTPKTLSAEIHAYRFGHKISSETEAIRRLIVLGLEVEKSAAGPMAAAAPDMLAALKRAEQFIVNGASLGFIRMPDPEAPDSAHDTLPAIQNAIAKACAMTAPIITRFISPPIGTRDHDWVAYRDGDEEEGLQGFGATEAAAKQELIELEAECRI